MSTWTVLSLPIQDPDQHRVKRNLIDDSVQRYLMQYGYLPMSDLETGNLRTLKQLQDALRVMQRFGQIPQTGEFDAATRALMRRPRCSLPDVLQQEAYSLRSTSNALPPPGGNRQKRFVKQGSVWDRKNLTWGLRSYPANLRDDTANPKHLSRWEIQREFRLAAQVWASASQLSFTQLTSNPEKADILVDFRSGYHGDGYPFDGAGRTLAHAFYPGEGIGGDMHFDSDEPWAQHKDVNSSYELISLFITVAHELGHALGLYHSDVPGSLMSPYLISFPADFHLPMDDTRAIQELYGADENWSQGGPEIDGKTYRPTAATPAGPSYRPSSSGSTTKVDDTPSRSTVKPETCNTHYDAISVIRGEIYVFRGKYFWRIDGKGRPRPNYPAEITRFWQMLPSNLTNIDAVYERPVTGKIVFFIGNRYFVYRGNEELLETGPLRRFGLPSDLPKLDAVFVWGHNGRTYFFADTMYWRYEEEVSHVELDYPRDMAMWRGIPYNIDSAFKYNGTTYFFKGLDFYEFDDLRMKATPRSPLSSASFWFNCPGDLSLESSFGTSRSSFKEQNRSFLWTFAGALFVSFVGRFFSINF